MKNTITEIKNRPEWINRLDDTEEQISKLEEDRVVEITEAEQQKEKKNNKNKGGQLKRPLVQH